LLVVMVAAGLLGVVPARAAVSTLEPPTWSAPVDLDAPNEVGRSAAVGIDADGTATAIWLADTGAPPVVVRAATHEPGGSWSDPVDLSEPVELSGSLTFAEDTSGRAVAAWSGFLTADVTLFAATRDIGGHWAPTVALDGAGGNPSGAQATIDEMGHAVLAWQVDGAIRSATYTFGSGWSSVETLTNDAQASRVRVSSNADGHATAVWWLSSFVVMASSRPSGGSWSAPEMISSPGVHAQNANVAQSPGAAARALWSEQHGSDWVLVDAERSDSGTWSAPTDVTPVTFEQGGPILRSDQAGNSVVLFGGIDGGDVVVLGTSRTASGPWTPVVQLTPEGSGSWFADLAVNPGGSAIVVLSGFGSDSTTWTRVLPFGGAWSAPERVDAAVAGTRESRIAANDQGHAAITWTTPFWPPRAQAVTSPTAPPPLVLVPMFTG
jgi:hypothetical protein